MHETPEIDKALNEAIRNIALNDAFDDACDYARDYEFYDLMEGMKQINGVTLNGAPLIFYEGEE